MRSTSLLAATAATALAALCLTVAAPGAPREVSARAAAASGSVSITNSEEGRALFTATGMRPGHVVAGQVRIGNGGDSAGLFSVAATGLGDVPGPLGGRLSGGLGFELRELSGGATLRTLYSGTPAGLGDVALGTFAPGEQRDYELVAWLPDTAADDVFQAASMSMGVEWHAVAVVEETPTPTATPIATVTPTPTPTATPTPEPPIVTIEVIALDADEAGLPSASSCLPRRKIRFRLRRPSHVAPVKAVVRVNHRRVGRARHSRRITVNLRRVATRRAKVRVRIWASDGRIYVVKRTYRMCH